MDRKLLAKDFALIPARLILKKKNKMGKNISVLKELQKLPNVGPATAGDLVSLGIKKVEDLKGKDPEKLYLKLEKLARAHVDRCMLYVMRSLVYMAETGERNPKKVAWWLFKDTV
jgi:nucleotidyltransferase/DNA polymerase involved in DNA repair